MNLILFAQAAAEALPAGARELPWYEKFGPLGYMISGGVFMWPILAMAIVAAAVVIERYRSLNMLTTDSEDLRAQVLELLRADKVEQALDLCNQSRGPVAAVLTVGLRRYLILRRLNYDPARIEEQVIKAMDDYSVHIVAALEKHLPILSNIAAVAPMVGSVGTVVGMVILFQGIAKMSGSASIVQEAAEGIQIKLLVTVWGLLVGIPSYIAFNYFTTTINHYVLRVEETATELIEAVTLQMALMEQQQRRSNEKPDGVVTQIVPAKG